ncbi:DUF4349 domain-containing protein [uncultured Eubacterium sp.]|uniref:DUF4349 domain-containing protein n=1 Tax=uncultured Eubacterium sp. TaxID=165185 RepID=UPI0025DCD7B6|nr:DUF4349 domain-containing protein [uncultured Eubacterium sp.]MCI6538375.1 DUF4349 domain-containing protein [Lachnospiraceae bacterium]
MRGKKKTGKPSDLGRRLLCVLLAGSMLAVSMGVIGCGSSTGVKTSANQTFDIVRDSVDSGAWSGGQEASSTENAVEADGTATEGTQAQDTGADANGVYGEGIAADVSQKLIKTVNMTAETTEFDALVADVRAKTESTGGYVENSDIGGSYGTDQTRYAYLVLRIPAEQLDDFVNGLKDTSNVRSFGESTEDVTLQYTDMDTHIKALREELDALFSMMEQADSMKDILSIQSQITDVRYEIESYESQLRVYDNQINYSTIYLDLYEVNRESLAAGKTFGDRVHSRFNDNLYRMGQGFQDFLVGLLGGLPILIPVVVICVVIVIVVRKILHKRKHRKAENKESDSEKA